ncbi:protease inhibitor I9 family protein [Streptomyces viridochromogenes]|uniref:protease inhibitor I9 family protein n=1 Tax=Streptomyces viridochromogenes TaxID=1938 RepID=UPI00069F171E|nr:protease inhibitor I9 family protein [Streptomyces viridochromogenes]KOG17086.1 hypothetical protein ADK35_24810 [Streptomyces viridochromogenes]KOG20107.1 hypothetical protein ADK36_17470 [Streptomyces viridochromogenes]
MSYKHHPLRTAGTLLIPVLAGALALGSAVLPEGPGPGQQNDPGVYVVKLSDASTTSYDHDALDTVPDLTKLHAYHFTAHGFTARLTGEQAAALGALPCVTSVIRGSVEAPTSSVPSDEGPAPLPPVPSPTPLPAPSPPTDHGEDPGPVPQSMGGQRA